MEEIANESESQKLPNKACTDVVGSQGCEGSCEQKDEPNGKQFGSSLVWGVF